MANTNDTKNNGPVLAALTELPTKPSTHELLEAIQLRRLQKEEEAEAEADRLAVAARKANIESIRVGERIQEANQKECTHRKPNNEPCIAGQRLHSHAVAYICLNCQKEFIGNALPASLRIDSQKIGGPNY